MRTNFRFSRSLQAVVLAAMLAISAAAQSLSLVVRSIPVGKKPVGLAETTLLPKYGGLPFEVDVAVANSQSNFVTFFSLSNSTFNTTLLSPAVEIGQIPGPNAVSYCGAGLPYLRGNLVAASPGNNSISVVLGDSVNTIPVGPQPYNVLCAPFNHPIVSNFGDSSLVALAYDKTSSHVLSRLNGVPGSRGWRGLSWVQSSSGKEYLWVAGTEANVVTIVDISDINAMKVVTQIPVRRPTAVFGTAVASETDNAILVFNSDTLALVRKIENVPSPQDLTSWEGTLIASTGAGELLLLQDPPVPIPGTAGSAAVASFFFSPTNDGILATNPGSNSLLLIQRPGPPPSPPAEFHFSNSGGFSPQVAPGSLASAFSTTGVPQSLYANSVPLPKTLGGVTLKIGGSVTFNAVEGKWDYSPTGSIEAPLHFVGPNQINFQIPPGISLGDSVPAQITKPDGTTLLSTVRITASAPGIFSVLMNGVGQAAALNQDNSQNFGTNPAKRGSVIQIFATGAGDTDPPLLPGEAAPVSGNPLFLTRVQPTVSIGGLSATVQFSGMAPGWVGLWQINAEVPATTTPGTAVPLVVTAGGVTSNTVTIAVE